MRRPDDRGRLLATIRLGILILALAACLALAAGLGFPREGSDPRWDARSSIIFLPPKDAPFLVQWALDLDSQSNVYASFSIFPTPANGDKLDMLVVASAEIAQALVDNCPGFQIVSELPPADNQLYIDATKAILPRPPQAQYLRYQSIEQLHCVVPYGLVATVTGPNVRFVAPRTTILWPGHTWAAKNETAVEMGAASLAANWRIDHETVENDTLDHVRLMHRSVELTWASAIDTEVSFVSLGPMSSQYTSPAIERKQTRNLFWSGLLLGLSAALLIEIFNLMPWHRRGD